MLSVQYGNKTIAFTFREMENLKAHYITVQKGEGVVLKGKTVSDEYARKLILKKAKWILDKLDLVKSIGDDDIVTGSRVQYLGRRYYVDVFVDTDRAVTEIDFTESKFKVYLPKGKNNQGEIKEVFEVFLREKAIEKITPRVIKWSKETGFEYNALKFMKLEKRWGSCTPGNNIIINVDAVKLPFSLIDYLIVHELVHTKVKNHSKEFWAEVSKWVPDWRELDSRMWGMRL